jgi:hypothetical protein
MNRLHVRVDPALPGAELVEQGLADLDVGLITAESLAVRIAAPRLRRVGMHVPASPSNDDEIALYQLLCARGERDPYSAYNAMLRRVVSFARALEQSAYGMAAK